MARLNVTSERLVLGVAVLVLVGGLVGTVWATTAGSTTGAPRIDANVSERYAAVDGLSANRTTTIERNGTVASTTVHAVALRPGTGEKRLTLRSGAGHRYERRVSNGSTLWLYDSDERVATRIALGGVADDARQGDRIHRLFARLRAGDADGTSDDPPTVEPLPVVPQSGAGEPGVSRSGGARFGVSYDGTATVGDREAYVLRVSPRNDSAADSYEQTLWVDAEHFFPLKQRTAWTDDGERTVLTTTYTDVRFDPGLDDATFRPDFPANATVRTADTPETETYRQASALRAATDVSVPDPELPPSYSLTYATETTGQVRGVGLRYANGTSRITVAKYDFTFPAQGGDERVRIDGRRGELSHGATTTLSWRCESYRYTVRGQGVPSDVVVDVGRSVGCPGGGE